MRPIDFAIFGLPHSGTTWAANWLTTDRSLCLHDPVDHPILRDGSTRAGQGRDYVGIACTGSWLNDWLPRGTRFLILDRPQHEVIDSVASIGLNLPTAMLDRFRKMPGRRVAWQSLFDQKAAAEIWQYLVPGIPFDAERHALLGSMVVRSDGRMPSDDMALLQTNAKALMVAFTPRKLADAKQLAAEYPVGDPFGGPAFGQKQFIGAIIGAVVGSVVSGFVAEAVVGAILEGGIISTMAATVGGSVLASGIGIAAGGLASMAVRSMLGPSVNAPQSVAQAAQIAQGVLLNTAGTIDPINVVYGSRKIGGTLVYAAASGSSNEYLHVVLALCEGEISAINTVYLDNVASSDSKFSGLVTIEKYVGTDAQAASAALGLACPAWTSTHTLSGVAYLYLKLQYSQSVFSSIPVITADVDGKKVYDPRDTTTKFSNNPALCIRDYLTNTRYGRGIPTSAIDDAAIIAAANACDVLVAIPTGTQATYTCDGLVNTDAAPLSNLSDLLTSCRGFMVFSGGKYKLKLDQAGAAGFAFTEDNILGKWSIKLPEKRNRANRVRATWFDPGNSWQPNITVQESTTYRAEDNGVLLEAEFSLPFTSNLYRAQQIAQQTLKQSRKQTLCQFTATIAGLRCEVGDLVTITHSTPGWSAKIFRVVRMALLSSDEVEVTAIEYDATVYNLDPLVLVSGLPGTNLPDPNAIAAPGVPTVVETLYQTSGSAGVKSKATMSWLAVANIFVVDYLPEYLAPGASVWTALPATRSLSQDAFDLVAGIHQFRVRARSVTGAVSAASGILSQELLGLTAPPSAVTAFSVIASNGVAICAWALSPDLDVRIGGRIVVRWTPLTAGAAWENGIGVGEFNGDAVGGLLPMLTGTYLIKAKDSTANWSATAASFVLTASALVSLPNSMTVTEHPAFTGAKSGTAANAGTLALDGTTLIDSMASLIDTWGYIDSLGGVASVGTYDFAALMDFGSVVTRRITPTIQALAFDTGDLVDSRGMVDDWDSVDGAVINDATAALLAATSTDAVSYGAWFPLPAGDVTCRAIKYRLALASAAATHNIGISQLSVTANW